MRLTCKCVVRTGTHKIVFSRIMGLVYHSYRQIVPSWWEPFWLSPLVAPDIALDATVSVVHQDRLVEPSRCSLTSQRHEIPGHAALYSRRETARLHSPLAFPVDFGGIAAARRKRMPHARKQHLACYCPCSLFPHKQSTVILALAGNFWKVLLTRRRIQTESSVDRRTRIVSLGLAFRLRFQPAMSD
jgi:hypothetical protein